MPAAAPRNQPDPLRTRAIVRARYIRRTKSGRCLQVTKRIAVIGVMGEVIADLVRRRMQLGLTTEELEERAGIADNHLAKIETGTRIPSAEDFW